DIEEDIWKPVKDPDLIEKGLSYAATIAQYAISEGIPTGFVCNSYIGKKAKNNQKQRVRVESKNSSSQLTHLLETMAKLNMDKSTLFKNLLKEEIDQQWSNMDVLLITSYVSEGMQESINQLKS